MGGVWGRLKKQTNCLQGQDSKLCHAHSQKSSYSEHYKVAQAKGISAGSTHPFQDPLSPPTLPTTDSFHGHTLVQDQSFKTSAHRGMFPKMNFMSSSETKDDFRQSKTLICTCSFKQQTERNQYLKPLFHNIYINLSFIK